MARGGALHRVDEPLVLYRYHAAAASHAIPRRTLHLHRVRAIEEQVLRRWPSFSIWGAGRDGREFFKALRPETSPPHLPASPCILTHLPCISPISRKALRPETRSRVAAFCDVDPSKVSK